ncbi:hypothetical protein JOM56_006405 [Amanita muscaria]
MTITKLYMQYLRQIKGLPVLYLRQFFRLKAADDARAIARSNDPVLVVRKLKRVRKDIRKVAAANQGNVKAFVHVLDLAYGRKGKLRRELMEPLLSDSCSHPSPATIIPPVEKSRPPVYSAELRALLTSALSRTTKPLKLGALSDPPTLPAQAKSGSEDALLYGTFSKRREVNIRWRYFTAEWNKVLPPLHKQKEPQSTNHDRELQNTNLFNDIEQLVGPSQKPLNLTRRESQNQGVSPALMPTHSICHHQSRWLRRRYEQLLGRIPILNYTQRLDPKFNDYRTDITVTLSPRASRPSLRVSEDRISDATSRDILWCNSRKVNSTE